MASATDASAPDTARVFRTARIARWEVAARNRLRSRSGFAVPRRAPTAVGGRSQARCCTCAALSAVGDRRASVDDCWAGLPVTQRRPWPAEDVWSEPRAAPARCTGAGKRAERFHAASSRPAIRAVLTTPGASGATHLSSSRIPYSPRTRAQREYERSTFSGSRKSASDGQGRRCVGSRTARVVQRRSSAGAPNQIPPNSEGEAIESWVKVEPNAPVSTCPPDSTIKFRWELEVGSWELSRSSSPPQPQGQADR